MEPATALITTAELDRKVEKLLSLQKITAKSLESLNAVERRYFGKVATEILAELHGAERSEFLEKIGDIVDVNTKNEIWENNHKTINKAITDYMRNDGFMPSKSKISQLTGFSRQTIAKHLKEYKQHSAYLELTEQFKLMSHRVLAGVFKFATNGDMRAARLYFEMIGALNKQQTGTVVNEQNNYIQINNTILSQENLKQLSAQQLNQIESIVNTGKLY